MKMRTAAVVLATTAAVSVLGAPAANADEPPAFDIPVEVIPTIVVPPEINTFAAGVSGAVANAILGFNAGNDAAVRGLFGLLGGGFCALAAGSSSPCATGG